MENIDPSSTALVLIDLQQGILGYAGGPHTAATVLANAAKLATRFRQLGAPVFLVRVGFSSDFGDALRQPTDKPTPLPAGGLPPAWWHFPPELAVVESDILITKRQWGAFYGTELDLQLRRRSIQRMVLGGISTNIGVESTARAGWEHGYSLYLAEDAMSAASAELHAFALEHIFPRLGRIRSTEQILQGLG